MNNNVQTLSIADQGFLENIGVARIIVTRSSGTGCVTGYFRTIAEMGDGKATADGPGVMDPDFTPVSAGNFSFAAGQVSTTLEVALLDDALLESPETFLVRLFSLNRGGMLQGMPASDDTATITIEDDDSDRLTVRYTTDNPSAPERNTLRDAIDVANANRILNNTITFADAALLGTILLNEALPAIEDEGLVIDGGLGLTTPRVTVSPGMGVSATGLVVIAPNVKLQGLALVGFQDFGVHLMNDGAELRVAGASNGRGGERDTRDGIGECDWRANGE